MFTQTAISKNNLKLFALFAAALALCLTLAAAMAPSASAGIKSKIHPRGKIIGKNGNWGLRAKVKLDNQGGSDERLESTHSKWCWSWSDPTGAPGSSCYESDIARTKGRYAYLTIKHLGGKKPKKTKVQVEAHVRNPRGMIPDSVNRIWGVATFRR